MSTDIISNLAMDMAMERHGAFNAEDRADEYTDLAETVYRNHVEPQDAIKRELLEALEELVIDTLITQRNMREAAKSDPRWEGCAEEIQTRIDAARAAIAKAKGGAA